MGIRPKLSIIIPVYNVEQYLHQCIDSVLGSSFQGFELLLVDDGSNDNSGSICDEYVKKDNRVRVFHQPNGGVSKARNVGIDNAKAPWIAFVDADDWISESFLANLYKAVEEHPDVDFVHAGFTNYSEKGIGDIELSYELYYGSDMNYLCPRYRGRPYGKLLKKDILQSVCFDVETSCKEDLMFITDYLIRVKKYVLWNEVGYYYRNDNGDSIMHAGRDIDYSEALHIFRHQYEGTTTLVKVHQISNKSADLRYQQIADSMVFAISRLYKKGLYTKTERLFRLRHDFTHEQLNYLKYASGRKNAVTFFLLRRGFYVFFDLLRA